MSAPAATRCGFVALIGATNAGKSTLVNSLVGTKVTIVSRKVQTTRSLIRGIVMRGESQIVLVDTPGIFEPRRRLDRAMVDTAWGGARDADAVALIVDAAAGLTEAVEQVIDDLGALAKPRIALLNKIDLVPRDSLLALAQAIQDRGTFDRIFMVSALTGDGLDDVADFLAATVPAGPWLYPEDEVSDLPLRRLAAEITREKLFERLHQELPYQTTVETDAWQEQEDGSVRVEQTIYVARDGHKKIVIGKGGTAVRAISMAARQELAEITERTVHLFVFVKVREKWIDDPERYREMGIEFPRDT